MQFCDLRDGGAIPGCLEYVEVGVFIAVLEFTGWRSHPELSRVSGGCHISKGKSKFRYGGAIAVKSKFVCKFPLGMFMVLYAARSVC